MGGHRFLHAGLAMVGVAIDAACVFDAVGVQANGFGTGFQRHAVGMGTGRKCSRQPVDFSWGDRRDPVNLQVLFHFGVGIHQAENAAVRMARQLVGQAGKGSHMPGHGIPLGQHDGVVTPDDPLLADCSGQLPERTQPFAECREVGLQIRSIGIQCELEIEGIRLGNLVQERQQGRRIFGPEDDAVYHVRGQTDSAHPMMIHRISDQGKAFPEAVHQPLRVESGNIRSATDA